MKGMKVVMIILFCLSLLFFACDAVGIFTYGKIMIQFFEYNGEKFLIVGDHGITLSALKQRVFGGRE